MDVNSVGEPSMWAGWFSRMWAPVPLCLVPGKFEQQPVLWCPGLLGVRTGIIEQRVADRGSWHWDQTDVAIIKKYTTSELNMKRAEHESRMVWTLSLLFYKQQQLFWILKMSCWINGCQVRPGELYLNYAAAWKWNFKKALKSILHVDSCSGHTADSLFRNRGLWTRHGYVKVF